MMQRNIAFGTNLWHKCRSLTCVARISSIALCIIAAFCVTSLGGCRTFLKPLEPVAKPVPISFPLQPPEGPAVYQQGWNDGCRSGLSSTNELVRPEFRFYKYNVDEELQFNKMYWRVWQDAYDYCAFTMLTLMKHHS